MYVVVIEVKVEEDNPSTSQNNKQMASLWRKGQKIMLGAEVSTNAIKVKTLIKDQERLIMCYFPQLPMNTKNIGELTRLFIAIIVIVQYSDIP